MTLYRILDPSGWEYCITDSLAEAETILSRIPDGKDYSLDVDKGEYGWWE